MTLIMLAIYYEEPKFLSNVKAIKRVTLSYVLPHNLLQVCYIKTSIYSRLGNSVLLPRICFIYFYNVQMKDYNKKCLLRNWNNDCSKLEVCPLLFFLENWFFMIDLFSTTSGSRSVKDEPPQHAEVPYLRTDGRSAKLTNHTLLPCQHLAKLFEGIRKLSR